MTVSYTYDVCSASATAFFRLLFRWKGSIWKCVVKELLIWTFIYLFVSFFYRSPFFLTQAQKISFENTVVYFEDYLKTINLTFILGFFVSNVTSRWTAVLRNMGYIESNALFISNYITGNDEEGRMMRRAILRYLCLSQAMVYRDISCRVRNRFPTLQSLVEAGYILENEKTKMDKIALDYDKYWVPINWAITLVFTARKTNRISGDILVNKLMDEIKSFRNNLQMLCNYDWVPLPLVYPQVINIAVYFYFAICLFSRQFIITNRDDIPAKHKSRIDLIIPIMTMIQYAFYVGWMKVAMALLNPLGEDDDDFETNHLLDKNLATCLVIVDKYSGDVPDIKEDIFFGCGTVAPLYPESGTVEDRPLIGSAAMASMVNKTEQQPTKTSSSFNKRSTLRRLLEKTKIVRPVEGGHRIRTHSEGPVTPTVLNGFTAFERSVSCSTNDLHEADSSQVKHRSHNPRRFSLAPSWMMSTVQEEEPPPAEQKEDNGRQHFEKMRRHKPLRKAFSMDPEGTSPADSDVASHPQAQFSRSLSFIQRF